MPRTVSWSLVILAALALAFSSVRIASAHAEFESSVPAPDASLAVAPERVTIVFTEEVNAEGNSVTVTDATGAVVSEEEVTLERSDANRATISVALKPNLAAGRYTVAWKNAGADGHSEEGTFTFSVSASAAPATGGSGTTSTSPTTLPRTAGETAPTTALLVAVLALLLGVMARRRAAR